jgi:hypothetical protein
LTGGPAAVERQRNSTLAEAAADRIGVLPFAGRASLHRSHTGRGLRPGTAFRWSIALSTPASAPIDRCPSTTASSASEYSVRNDRR